MFLYIIEDALISSYQVKPLFFAQYLQLLFPRVLTSYILSLVLISYIFHPELITGKDEMSVLSGKYTIPVLVGNMMYILGGKYGLSTGVKI